MRLGHGKMVSILRRVDSGVLCFQLALSLSKSRPLPPSFHYHLFNLAPVQHSCCNLVCLDSTDSTVNLDPAFVIDPPTRSRTLDGPRNSQQLCERLNPNPCAVRWCSGNLVGLPYRFEDEHDVLVKASLTLDVSSTLDR